MACLLILIKCSVLKEHFRCYHWSQTQPANVIWCLFFSFFFWWGYVHAFEHAGILLWTVPLLSSSEQYYIVAFHSSSGKLLVPPQCPTHTSRILSDRPLPAEPWRVIGIQDHLDDREGGEFHETLLPCFYPAPQSSPRSVPHLYREREGETAAEIDTQWHSERDREGGRDYFACSELAVASLRETLSVRGKQLSMHEEKSPSGLCCS